MDTRQIEDTNIVIRQQLQELLQQKRKVVIDAQAIVIASRRGMLKPPRLSASVMRPDVVNVNEELALTQQIVKEQEMADIALAEQMVIEKLLRMQSYNEHILAAFVNLKHEDAAVSQISSSRVLRSASAHKDTPLVRMNSNAKKSDMPDVIAKL